MTPENTRHWSGIAAIYTASFLLGISIMSFPSAGNVFKTVHQFSDTQYGSIYLPNILVAILGGVIGARISKCLGLRQLFLIGLGSNFLSMVFFAGSHWMIPHGSWSYSFVMVSTGFNGLGFGMGGVAVNTYPSLFFPKNQDIAYIGLHAILGIGAALSAQILEPFRTAGFWAGFPLMIAGLYVVLIGFSTLAHFPETPNRFREELENRSVLHSFPFWLFCAVAFLYAMAECTFSNWLVIYLTLERGLPANSAANALSAYWGAVTLGRLATLAGAKWVPPSSVYPALPVLMAVSFLSIPLIETSHQGILLFGLAGLSCSSFYPLTMSRAVRFFPGSTEWVTGMIPASLALGVGAGSFLPGPLQSYLTLGSIYRMSILYPLLILLCLAVFWKTERGKTGTLPMEGVRKYPEP
jgi:fucose permease